jgi:2-dehydro-3-deoxygluconokinase
MKVAIIGEAMLEYRSQPRTACGLTYGGDTLNTAIHMVRAGCETAYVTVLGRDPLSDALAKDWQCEGLDTRFVLRHATKQPGIYAIHVDSLGERSFTYWRDDSAARTLFDVPDIDLARDYVADADLLYFSHISLAILPTTGREALLDLANLVRARGGQVAYDSNFRPGLWDQVQSALTWSNSAIATASIGLPTAEDEQTMLGAEMTGEDITRRWQALGCREVIVKRGPAGPVIAADGISPFTYPCDPLPMVDSSGAGDAFNAGYLLARLRGQSPKAAAQCGHELAAWVISKPGAIPPWTEEAPYHRLSNETGG